MNNLDCNDLARVCGISAIELTPLDEPDTCGILEACDTASSVVEDLFRLRDRESGDSIFTV